MEKIIALVQVGLGGCLYGVKAYTKKIYKDCKLCENTRKIQVYDKNGKSYELDCSNCIKKNFYGDKEITLPFIDVKEYLVINQIINEIRISKNNVYLDTIDNSTLKYFWDNETQFYLSKVEAEQKCIEYNIIEQKKIKQFLEE